MDYNYIWDDTLRVLSSKIPKHAISAWFEPIKAIGISNGKLIIEVPNRFSLDWIDTHYKEELLNALNRGENQTLTYSFKIANNSSKEESLPRFSVVEEQKKPKHQNNLNKQYQFKNYIEGSNNEFAKNAAMAVTNNPGENNFNPLILYGGVGLGKTHLMHAIGNGVIAQNPNLRVVVVTSEKFTLDFVNSLRKNKTIEFAQRYRASDILLIDDIQFSEEKNKLKNSFFTLLMYFISLVNK